MSKYPLDQKAMEEMSADILQHSRAQDMIISQLSKMVSELLPQVEDIDDDERDEAESFLKSLRVRKVEFENHRFNQKNGINTTQRSPYGEQSVAVLPPNIVLQPSKQIDIVHEGALNAIENSSGEMTEEEIETLFGGNPQDKISKSVKKKKKEKALAKMSLSEIETWERAQDNSNDIYKVSARIKNLARAGVKANLTPQGDMVCNTFTHMIKNFYDFAETISDKETRIKLSELTRKQEELPANLIAALNAGVRS